MERVNRMLGSVKAPFELAESVFVDPPEPTLIEGVIAPLLAVSFGSTNPLRTSGARYPNDPAA